jgi:hypothetical protein
MTDEQSSAPPIPAAAARAGDADREAVAERLRIAAGDGRIDLAELDERLAQAYAAKTYGQLEVLVADLPVRSASIPKAAEADPGAPTIIVTGHPVFGYIRIKQRHRKR